jgi:hypothetical protein
MTVLDLWFVKWQFIQFSRLIIILPLFHINLFISVCSTVRQAAYYLCFIIFYMQRMPSVRTCIWRFEVAGLSPAQGYIFMIVLMSLFCDQYWILLESKISVLEFLQVPTISSVTARLGWVSSPCADSLLPLSQQASWCDTSFETGSHVYRAADSWWVSVTSKSTYDECYFLGPQFESWLGDSLSLLKFVAVFFLSSRILLHVIDQTYGLYWQLDLLNTC